jgi:hypothetical protein
MKILLLTDRLEEIRREIKKIDIRTAKVKGSDTHVKISKNTFNEINNYICNAIYLIDSIIPESTEL